MKKNAKKSSMVAYALSNTTAGNVPNPVDNANSLLAFAVVQAWSATCLPVTSNALIGNLKTTATRLRPVVDVTTRASVG